VRRNTTIRFLEAIGLDIPNMNLELPFMGGCLCGALRYQCAEAPVMVLCCHCTDCQRRTGSAFGITVSVKSKSFRVLQGETTSWLSIRQSGNKLLFQSCAICGTRCWGELPDIPASTLILGGTLDDATSLKPNAHIYTSTKQPWVSIPDNIYSSEDMPDWHKVFSS